MTVEERLIAKTTNALERVANDVEIHPEKGVFKFTYTPFHSHFDIFTNISPEEVSKLTLSTLIWERHENGTRLCKLKFYLDPDCDEFCIAFLWRVDGFWPNPD